MSNTSEFFDNDIINFDIETLRISRTFLILALVGATISLPISLSNKGMAFGIVCIALTLIAGIAGIKKLTQIQRTNSLLELLAIFSLFLPGLNILTLAFLLFSANKEMIKKEKANRLGAARNRIKQQSGNKASNLTKEDSPTTERISKAMPMVKLAGLPDMPEFTRLEATINSKEVSDTSGDSEPVVLAIKGVFGVMYAVDTGNSLTFLNMGDVRKAGINLEQLHQISIRNLTAKVNDEQTGLKLRSLGNSYGLTLGGLYESSLVLLDSLWETTLKHYLPQAPVVTIAARDICAFCDKYSISGIAEIHGVGEKVSQRGEHLISSEMFTRNDDGRWRKYEQ